VVFDQHAYLLSRTCIGQRRDLHARLDTDLVSTTGAPLDTTAPPVLRHEDKFWLTLVTCADYDETAGTYRSAKWS